MGDSLDMLAKAALKCQPTGPSSGWKPKGDQKEKEGGGARGPVKQGCEERGSAERHRMCAVSKGTFGMALPGEAAVRAEVRGTAQGVL